MPLLKPEARCRTKDRGRDQPTAMLAHGVLTKSKGYMDNRRRTLHILLGIGIAALSVGLVFLFTYWS